MYSVIDTGTTNTRIYIVKDTGEIVAKAYRKVGVRDTAISGSKKALVDGIVACFHDALANGGLREDDINLIFVSGMLTSELGLIDLPHICAPAGIDELVEQCVITNNTDILPFDIPIAFIRGIKHACYIRRLDIHGFHEGGGDTGCWCASEAKASNAMFYHIFEFSYKNYIS